MNVESMNYCIKMLVGNLKFMTDYNSFTNNSKRMLLVEGETDKKFIRDLLTTDVTCITANKAFGKMKGFSDDKVNYKNAIVKVVYGLSRIPTLINCPKDAINWNIFGMVDLDFDDTEEYLGTNKLFVTDTHDLETLLLSTDNELLKKLKKCVISEVDSKKAFYMAYQLGVIRNVLYDLSDKDFELKYLSTCDVEYSRFFNAYVISVKKIIKYLNNKNNNILSISKEKNI